MMESNWGSATVASAGLGDAAGVDAARGNVGAFAASARASGLSDAPSRGHTSVPGS